MSSNYQSNAVHCSFYGDYVNSIDQATKEKSVSKNPIEDIFGDMAVQEDMKNSLIGQIQSNEVDEIEKAELKKMLSLLNAPKAEELFEDAKQLNALNYIEDKAKDYHFTLLNEAHYNSQHRCFTESLLKPLWDKGYRYLALETLSHGDIDIHERGYPNRSSGFYTKDSNFGNLLRKALEIGYVLIPYETRNKGKGTKRERDQAQNIYDKTLKQDKIGKVLIHAGYDHIFKNADSAFQPMGYQLMKLTNQDILAIDQVRMIGYNNPAKEHTYYKEAVAKFNFQEPTVFMNKQDSSILDPLSSLGIDIQVYHPRTKFQNGRAQWLYKPNYKSIPLSPAIQGYSNHLIQAVKKGEALDAIPVDQFVISKDNVLLLPPGDYDLRLVNCEGNMTAKSELVVY